MQLERAESPHGASVWGALEVVRGPTAGPGSEDECRGFSVAGDVAIAFRKLAAPVHQSLSRSGRRTLLSVCQSELRPAAQCSFGSTKRPGDRSRCTTSRRSDPKG